jgi:hypothetical protein
MYKRNSRRSWKQSYGRPEKTSLFAPELFMGLDQGDGRLYGVIHVNSFQFEGMQVFYGVFAQNIKEHNFALVPPITVRLFCHRNKV